MLVNYYREWCLLWNTLIHSMTLHWVKFIFLLQRRYQLQLVSWVGIELGAHFHTLSAGTSTRLNLCRSCVCHHILCKLMCASILNVWKAMFPWNLPQPLALIIFLLFLIDAQYASNHSSFSCRAHDLSRLSLLASLAMSDMASISWSGPIIHRKVVGYSHV